jgi:hypothetical protein
VGSRTVRCEVSATSSSSSSRDCSRAGTRHLAVVPWKGVCARGRTSMGAV